MFTSPAATNAVPDPVQWSFPDSEVCTAALRLVAEVSPAVLSNHCVRSYVFGREIAASRDLRSGIDYDDETLFLACVLHDLGLTDYGAGDERFEIQGADAAARFLRGHNVTEDRVTTIWQCIALHSSLGLSHRFGVVQALSIAGISFDIDGVGMADFSPDFIERVSSVWPRHDVGFALGNHIARDIRDNPSNPLKAPPFTLPGHVNELINTAPAITLSDVIADAAWGDRPVTD
jgi:hypothetical protein